MATLASMLENGSITLGELTAHLDKLPHAGRVAESIALGGKHQARLWTVAEGKGEPLTLDFLVPADAKPLEPVPFEGKNSLPVFTLFQKVFYRQRDGLVGGYNKQTLSPITGPGYFLVDAFKDAPGEVGVNYLKVPSEAPAGWPPIQRNEAGLNLSRFIYANMIDYLRWVSKDVVIGRAYRAGEKAMPNWFILCRARRL
ncbi:MAG: hypothetical protein KC466_11605 [Myxococcales bacterium]|nr:hypothetical protein [Myxococcales bacterium]